MGACDDERAALEAEVARLRVELAESEDAARRLAYELAERWKELGAVWYLLLVATSPNAGRFGTRERARQSSINVSEMSANRKEDVTDE